MQAPSSPSPESDPRANIGAGRALLGIVLTFLGLLVGLVGGALVKQPHRLGEELLGEGATVAGLLALAVAGWVTLVLGLLVMLAGVVLLGKRGKPLMARFGGLLLVGGTAAYLADLMFNQGPNKLARLFGLLGAALGLFVMAIAKGWIGGKGMFDE